MRISTLTDRHKSILKKIAAVIFALILWQIGAMLLDQRLLLVSPITVVQRLLSLCAQADFFSILAFSFIRIVTGFLLALLLGSVFAVVAGRFHILEVMLWPFMVTIKSVPVASFIILCLIWLSSRNLSIFISFLMVLPIVYTNMLQGIKSTDKKLLEMATVFRVGWLKRIKFIHLPQLKSYIISACSVALGLSWKAGVAAEVIGIPDGSIGEKLYEAKVYLSTGDLFAWTLVIILISVVFEKMFLALLNKLFARVESS